MQPRALSPSFPLPIFPLLFPLPPAPAYPLPSSSFSRFSTSCSPHDLPQSRFHSLPQHSHHNRPILLPFSPVSPQHREPPFTTAPTVPFESRQAEKKRRPTQLVFVCLPLCFVVGICRSYWNAFAGEKGKRRIGEEKAEKVRSVQPPAAIISSTGGNLFQFHLFHSSRIYSAAIHGGSLPLPLPLEQPSEEWRRPDLEKKRREEQPSCYRLCCFVSFCFVCRSP